MNQQLQRRLDDLRAEFAKGEQQLEEKEKQITQLRQTLLRISGAIQVLEELLAAPSEPGSQSLQGNTDAGTFPSEPEPVDTTSERTSASAKPARRT